MSSFAFINCINKNTANLFYFTDREFYKQRHIFLSVFKKNIFYQINQEEIK